MRKGFHYLDHASSNRGWDGPYNSFLRNHTTLCRRHIALLFNLWEASNSNVCIAETLNFDLKLQDRRIRDSDRHLFVTSDTYTVKGFLVMKHARDYFFSWILTGTLLRVCFIYGDYDLTLVAWIDYIHAERKVPVQYFCDDKLKLQCSYVINGYREL